MAGTKSQIVRSVARRAPWLFRPVVRAACSAYVRTATTPHWLVTQLKDELGVRLSHRMNIDGFVIEADPLDGPGARFAKEGLTEPETREAFAELLRPAMTVLDVGAYVGQFSLVAARAMHDQGRIVAFEPMPSVFAQLERNIRANGYRSIVPMQLAISDTVGIARFYVYIGSTDQSSLIPLSSGAVSMDVPVTTIDAIAAELTGAVHLIKIDVEGNELSALRGGRETLRLYRSALIIEISRHQRAAGYSGEQVKSFLDQYGYDVFRIAAKRTPYKPDPDEINASVSHFNVLALPK